MAPLTPITALLEAAAAEQPARPALEHRDSTLSFQELERAVERLAGLLPAGAGEPVAVVAPNVPAAVVGLFAVWRKGGVAVPLSARLRPFELQRVLADAQAGAAVCVTAHAGFEVAQALTALGEELPALGRIVVVDELGESVEQRDCRASTRSAQLGAEVAAILYTSGTTGEPRGALMSHDLGIAEGRELAGLLGPFAEAPTGLVVPVTHAFGLACLLSALAARAVAVLVDATASVDPLVEAVRQRGIEVLHGTPALFGRLLRTGAQLPLRSGFTAGSACPPEILKRLDGSGARILNLYGMTEIGAASACRLDDPAEARYQTVGRALPGYELRVPGGCPDAPRPIEVRGSHVLPGYHGRPWTPEETAGDGWLRTGDLGWLDSAGRLTVAGRTKELVHTGGFNVFPAEVESFLLTHPSIAQAAVVGVPHPVMGEALQAFVVPAPEAHLQAREVVRFARAGIAGYKVPYAVQVVGELPLLSSGKPDRRALGRKAQQEALA